MTRSPSPVRQRIVAESVRLEEDRLGRILDDPKADARACQAGGDFEQRLVHRAGVMAQGQRFAQTLDGLVHARFWLLVAVGVLAFLAGVGAAATVFGQEATVNIGWAIAALLGLQLLMLMLWIVFTLYRPKGGGGLLGRAAMAGAHVLGRRFSRRPESAVVLSAVVGLMRRAGLGRWIASALTHGLWATFCLGALLGSLFALTVRQYDFVWGTTLLSEASFTTLVEIMSAPANWLGWPVPSAEIISASRIGMSGDVGRELWSGLLLSSLLFYGLLPRALLTLMSLYLVRRSAGRLRLDTSLPGYARLSERLGPHARSIGVLDPRPPEVPGQEAAPRERPSPISGLVLLIGMELERAPRDWPPHLKEVDWTVLGRADDRSQRGDVLAALRACKTPPGVVLVLCSLARTPDRGAQRFLARVREQTQAPVWALLDEGNGLETRGIDRGRRFRQWQQAGSQAGLDFVLEVDLDDQRHPGTRQLLGLLVSGDGSG